MEFKSNHKRIVNLTIIQVNVKITTTTSGTKEVCFIEVQLIAKAIGKGVHVYSPFFLVWLLLSSLVARTLKVR